MFAQAGRPLPCLGTTHADYFRGEVPLTRPLTAKEISSDYETHTGRVIVERMKGMDPLEMPGVLVIHHGPFTWGRSPAEAVDTALVLEQVAKMAYGSLAFEPRLAPLDRHILEKHSLRKHGPEATYGQKKENDR